MKTFVGVIITLVGMGLTGSFAQAEPFIGEIRFFAGNFAPRGWALCDGQLLSIAQNQALFSILGTTYGGDGRTTFGLPDMRGRFPMHPGTGPGLTPRRLGERGGTEANSLSVSQMPAHTHEVMEAEVEIDVDVVATEYVGSRDRAQLRARIQSGASSGLALEQTMDTTVSRAIIPAGDTSSTGSGQQVNNMPPYIGINCIIALEGLFPSRP